MLDNYLNRKELAEAIGVNVATINKWHKKNLPYIQLGSGRKVYDLEAVKKWLLGEN